MIALILSIIASTCIFVIFKLFNRFNIDTFQAIVFNYYTALFCGLIFFGNEWNPHVIDQLTWIPSIIICALLFISIFALMGVSSLNNGIASTSVAAKMSMALSIGIIIVLYNEPLSLGKIVGIILAFIGVLLVSLDKKEPSNKRNSRWMLVVIFFGSVLLDVMLNYSQNHLLGYLSSSLFTAFAFGIAGLLGSIILTWMILNKKSKLSLKNVLGGIVLGIPNFFSIYLLLRAYDTAPLKDSDVVAIINIAIVCLSTIIGFLFFDEKINRRKFIGIVAVIAAIYLLSIF